MCLENERLGLMKMMFEMSKKLELLNLHRQTVDNESELIRTSSKLLSRLSAFHESVDHISIYFNRFEKYVTINKFTKEIHAMILSTYLKGSALGVFVK